MNDEIWTAEDIATWLKLDVRTVLRDIVSRPGFPPGFRPTGRIRGERRWLSEDVKEWARQAA